MIIIIRLLLRELRGLLPERQDKINHSRNIYVSSHWKSHDCNCLELVSSISLTTKVYLFVPLSRNSYFSVPYLTKNESKTYSRSRRFISFQLSLNYARLCNCSLNMYYNISIFALLFEGVTGTKVMTWNFLPIIYFLWVTAFTTRQFISRTKSLKSNLPVMKNHSESLGSELIFNLFGMKNIPRGIFSPQKCALLINLLICEE